MYTISDLLNETMFVRAIMLSDDILIYNIYNCAIRKKQNKTKNSAAAR